MLADPRHSRIVLVNPARWQPGEVSNRFAARWHDSLALLPAAIEILGVQVDVIGKYDPALFPPSLASVISLLDGDGMALWRASQFVTSLQASTTNAIFIGGAFLEEEVLVTALEGARLGYDVRLLADLSPARIASDRALVVGRLALHGVVTTTVRQALLEWAVCLDDPALIKRVQTVLR